MKKIYTLIVKMKDLNGEKMDDVIFNLTNIDELFEVVRTVINKVLVYCHYTEYIEDYNYEYSLMTTYLDAIILGRKVTINRGVIDLTMILKSSKCENSEMKVIDDFLIKYDDIPQIKEVGMDKYKFNNNEKTYNELIDKEMYAWNINDVWDIVVNEFKNKVPENLKEQIKEGGIAEGLIFTFDEIFDIDDDIPEFVKDYQGDVPGGSLDREYLYQIRGVGDLGYSVGVATVFKPIFDENNMPIDHKNRIIFIEMRDEDSNVLYRIHYVK